jgi:hypothetical protein
MASVHSDGVASSHQPAARSNAARAYRVCSAHAATERRAHPPSAYVARREREYSLSRSLARSGSSQLLDCRRELVPPSLVSCRSSCLAGGSPACCSTEAGETAPEPLWAQRGMTDDSNPCQSESGTRDGEHQKMGPGLVRFDHSLGPARTRRSSGSRASCSRSSRTSSSRRSPCAIAIRVGSHGV